MIPLNDIFYSILPPLLTGCVCVFTNAQTLELQLGTQSVTLECQWTMQLQEAKYSMNPDKK